MTEFRFTLVVGLLVLLTLTYALKGTAQPGTVKQIAPGVWFREGERRPLACNNIIIEMKDYLIVVDANFPLGAQACLADAKKVSRKPVKLVFDTHHHSDHAYGNPIWTKLGAVTLAYVGVVEEMKRYEPKDWQATKRKDVVELNLQEPEPPKQTFTKSPYIVDDGDRKVEFHFFGWGHTRGDGFVYLPKEKVLCTGDAVVNGPYNATSHSNLANWPNVIRQAQKLGAIHILPGHGGPGGPEILDGQIEFLTELYKTVQAAIKDGKKLEDLVTVKEGQRPTANIGLPESVKNWTSDRLGHQLKDTYEEITQSKPHGEIAGGK